MNTAFLIINESYGQHYSDTGILVDFGIVVVKNEDEAVMLLETIKRNRMISVKMHLLLILVGTESDENCSINILHATRKILNPFFVGIVSKKSSIEVATAWIKPLLPEIIYMSKNCSFEVPKKTTIPKGTALKAAVAHQDPYVRISGNNKDGIEIRIIEALAKNLNMEVKYVEWPPNENPRVTTNKDGHYAGLVGMLYRFEADVIAGGLFSQEARTNVLETLVSHTDDSLKYFISIPPLANNFGAILSVFTPMLWVLVVVVFTVSAVVYGLILASTCEMPLEKVVWTSILQTYSLLMDQELLKVPGHLLTLFLLTFDFVFAMIITNSYRSSLIRTLTSESRSKGFESLEEVIGAGEKIYLFSTGMHGYESEAKVSKLWKTILSSGRHEYITEFSLPILKKLYEEKKDIIICITQTCLSIIHKGLLDRNMKPLLMTIDKKFRRFPVTIFLAPGSPLQNILNERLSWMIEGGLVLNWRNRIAYSDKIKTMYSYMNDTKQVGPKKLTFQHLEPVFFILILMLCTSCILLIFEKYIRKR